MEARVPVEARSPPCDHYAVSPGSRLLSAAATVSVGVVLLGLASGPVVKADDTVPDPFRATAPGVYVVTLAAPPAAQHTGTRAADEARFDRTRPQVASSVDRLTAAQEEVLHTVGDPAVLYRYTTALNGFAATLTSDQVTRLRTTPGVELVERSTKQHLDRAPAALRVTPAVGSSSRSLLGLDGPGGVWTAHGGPENAGRNVVIGVVDTGIWPDNPSFNGLPQRTPGTAGHLPGFHGACDEAQEWTAEDCNDKVVSARWFVKGFGEENVATAEYLSPRDGTGHGSRSTRPAGPRPTRRRTAARRPTRSPRSTRRWPTGSTLSLIHI